jgi:hypothetical protein
MQLDVMLADFAEVHQNKLFITGAGINLLVVPPVQPYVVNFGVGLTVTVPWTATNQNHRLRIALVDRDEQIIPVFQPFPGIVIPEEDRGAIIANFNVGRAASMEVGEDSILPIAFQFPGLELPHPGSYKMTFEIDGTELAAARFRVFVPQMPAVMGGPAGLTMG